MSRPDSGLVVARTSFFSGNLLVRAGEVWAADDPAVVNYPAAFTSLVVHTTPKPRVVDKPKPKRSTARSASA